ncbi:isocitrate lyase/phosphoenolpyruvate mutase family protein [Exilibacterium tricleocarpae]|uniref:Isocitrate lyase/phosphoenolpyruvate mutase family protein n=1 Tax=Exilibacterium tricleocarpae TaxID=2591008 RepID=A0A545SZ18_9GAMM|nr:isocitrate lyase/phosphoenolpyruvate mutase family protein [Exilibacterium tricleocarpae]TQV70214.1 isocitrate lyase/phosphoenolpyruvate mutase family protein [Exilibacterium tricleocarpae]
MNQAAKARTFTELHNPGQPLALYNIWDAGGAAAIAKAGAKAIATASWAVAAAHGYADGEQIPLALVLPIVTRITETTTLPVTVDFESGYAAAPAAVAANVKQVLEAGAVGINFEDQIVGGSGLYATAAQCDRLRAIRETAQAQGIPLFINARTDLFLKQSDSNKHAELMEEAKARAAAYAEAGASGLFAPGLADAELIGELCEAVKLPVNIMMNENVPSPTELATLGVARISCGPGPYRIAMAGLAQGWRQLNGEA